jgi:lipoprotein-releasing system permease protein
VKIAVVGIALGVAVMLLTVAIVLGFKNEIVSKITGLTTHIAVSNIDIQSGGEPGAITVSTDTVKLLRALPGVEHVQPVAFKNGLLKTDKDNEGIVLKGVDKTYDFSFIEKHLTEGRLPVFSDSAAGREVLISSRLASRMDLKQGDRISVYFVTQRELIDSLSGATVTSSDHRSRRFTVCGVFKTGFPEYDERLCIGDLRQLRMLNSWPAGAAGTYEIRVKDFRQVDEVSGQVGDLLGFSYQCSTVKEIYSNIFLWLEKLDVNGIIIIVLMVAVATVNMITALLILILERSQMIGLLKSIGMPNVSVRKIFLRISLLLTGRGLLWGNIAGLLLLFVQYQFNIIGLDSDTYYVDHVAVELSWLHFIVLNIATFVVCALMLWLPTLIISRLTPVRTLKWD